MPFCLFTRPHLHVKNGLTFRLKSTLIQKLATYCRIQCCAENRPRWHVTWGSTFHDTMLRGKLARVTRPLLTWTTLKYFAEAPTDSATLDREGPSIKMVFFSVIKSKNTLLPRPVSPCGKTVGENTFNWNINTTTLLNGFQGQYQGIETESTGYFYVMHRTRLGFWFVNVIDCVNKVQSLIFCERRSMIRPEDAHVERKRLFLNIYNCVNVSF